MHAMMVMLTSSDYDRPSCARLKASLILPDAIMPNQTVIITFAKIAASELELPVKACP